jgi:hypothetical protein
MSTEMIGNSHGAKVIDATFQVLVSFKKRKIRIFAV